MEEWATYKLGEIAECSLGKMLDQRKNKGKPRTYLGNVAVRWGSFNIDPTQTMLFEDHELEKYSLKKNDIVICEGGEPGRCAIWKSNDTILIQKALHRVRVNAEIADPLYVYYYITHLAKSHLLEPLFTGSTIKHLPREILVSIEIRLPDLSKQKQISSILATIDDKRYTNSLINDNLEQQAKALYKSWFVDFEPFKDGDFIESEIGEIPAGWSIVKFSDISETPKKTINPQKFLDTTFCHYSLPACDNGLIPEIQTGRDIMSNKIILQNNTTLFSKLNPRIKRIWFTGEVLPNSICSTEFIPFRAKYDTESSYIFSIVNSDAFYATVMGCVNGATGSHQRFHAEDTEDFLCPYNKDVVNEFSKLVEPILSQMHDLRHENVMLASTRDALLPKLMSGELKINEIDC